MTMMSKTNLMLKSPASDPITKSVNYEGILRLNLRMKVKTKAGA